jgi:hypothetical protein
MNSFKYLELTRHYVTEKTKYAIQEAVSQSKKNSNNLSEIVFSSSFSLLVAFISERYFFNTESPLKLATWLNVLLLVLGFIIIFIVSLLVFRKICEKITKIYSNRVIHSPDISDPIIKEIIDDFDHIALDNLLIAKELTDSIPSLINDGNQEIATFYYHEAVYYLGISVGKTTIILDDYHWEKCLNINGNTRGIDLFRVYNAYSMMNNIIFKLKKQFVEITHPNEKMKSSLNYQISRIASGIDSIKEKCDNKQIIISYRC